MTEFIWITARWPGDCSECEEGFGENDQIGWNPTTKDKKCPVCAWRAGLIPRGQIPPRQWRLLDD